MCRVRLTTNTPPAGDEPICTGSGLPAKVQDKAGISTLVGEARSSLPHLGCGYPTEEQPVLAVSLQLLREQPALAVSSKGVLHSHHSIGQSLMEQPALAVPLASEEQPALAVLPGVQHPVQASVEQFTLVPRILGNSQR